MSDNTSDKEQQQQMKEIPICGDVWLEVFAFISPLELGHTMALISDRFDARVTEHFKTRKWSLGLLRIVPAFGGNGAEIVVSSGGRLPIPQGPIPVKVIGFKKLEIRYIDRSVIEFFQRLSRLFDSSGTFVSISPNNDQSRSWDIIRQKIWPLISDNIRHLHVHAYQLDCLRQDFPAILRNCTNLRSIDGLSHAFPAEDNANASSNQAVAKWLLTPRGDGFPKMLYYGGRMEELKRMSLFLRIFDDITNAGLPFELRNNLTRERLTFRREGLNWLLVRCPIERDEDKWAVWEKEAIEWQGFRQWNRITIEFNNRDIGDGMLPLKRKK
uniref:F-box domain-containing protein n=1 Tax=Globodera rostochiensis TaxID=31243 RepID=A0A914HHE3_GLORO